MLQIRDKYFKEIGRPMEDNSEEALVLGPRNTDITSVKTDTGRLYLLGDKRKYGKPLGNINSMLMPYHCFGPKNPRWKGGRMVKNGQPYVRGQKTHPLMDTYGYVREAILAKEEQLGRLLWSFERVYWIDKDKMNASIKNLGIRHIFEKSKRRWYVDENGHYTRWGTAKRQRTNKCGRLVMVKQEFAFIIRTDYNTPEHPYMLHDHILHVDKATGVTEDWIGITCKVCGRAEWQSLHPRPVVDYDRVCKYCSKKMYEKWHTVPKTEYWMRKGSPIIVTHRGVAEDRFVCDFRVDEVGPELAVKLQEWDDVKFWTVPVDKPTEQCIVKEECA